MNGTTLLLLLTMILLFAACLGYLLYYLRINKLNPMGKGAERKTARILKKYGGIRGFRVLSDIRLDVDGKTARIENMLIGYFGILLVHTCPVRGEYYGTLDSESWTVHMNEGREKHTIPNPVLEQQRAEALLRTLFSRNKVFKVPMERLVYRSSRAAKAGCYIANSGEIIAPGKLRAYLGKAKFDEDRGLDVKKIADIIAAANSAGPGGGKTN